MQRDDTLLSGFMNQDYLLTFRVADAASRARLADLCRDEWEGTPVSDNVWEISNDLSPDQMEEAILALMGEGDRAVYYYLTRPLGGVAAPSGNTPADSKRIYRVVLG